MNEVQGMNIYKRKIAKVQKYLNNS